MSEFVRYQDFDLEIVPDGSGAYRVRVLRSPGGEAEGRFTDPFEARELENFVLKMGHVRASLRGSPREHAAEEAARAVGERLYRAVFAGAVGERLGVALDALDRDVAVGLRVRLRLGAVPALADWPWEYLYHPARGRFLALSLRTPLTRYTEHPTPATPLSALRPLRVLAVAAGPHDQPPLNIAREREKLAEATGEAERRGALRVTWIEHATLEDVRKALLKETYHIFHFVGHGQWDAGLGEGMLVFEDGHGRSSEVDAKRLAAILCARTPPRLALLNACEGARGSATDVYAGVAGALVKQGVAAVIAMQFALSDEAGITLAREFYERVAQGELVETALAHARLALYAAQRTVEWGTPVLYLRAEEGRLFAVEAGDADKLMPVPDALAVDEPPALDGAVYARVAAVLMQCDEFASDVTMRDLFGHPRLRAFAGGLPQRDAPRARVLAVVNHLQGKYTRAGESVLAELLRVLSELYVGHARGKRLAELVALVAEKTAQSREDAKAQREDLSGSRGDPERGVRASGPVAPVGGGEAPMAALVVPQVPVSDNDRPVATVAMPHEPDPEPAESAITPSPKPAESTVPQASPVDAPRMPDPEPAEIAVTHTPEPKPAMRSTPRAPNPGPAEIVWVHVPADEFTMGSEEYYGDEKPVHPVYLDAHWIAQTPVTVAQFARFVEATGYLTEAERARGGVQGWIGRVGQFLLDTAGTSDWRIPRGKGSDVKQKQTHPVTCVSWADAQAFCAWLSKETKQIITLPTEAQWERAARGTEAWRYPWGNAFDTTRCNTSEGGIGDTTPVERYGPLGASPYGVWDMAGNVWEWCMDWYYDGYYARASKVNPTGPETGSQRVLRGGSWDDDQVFARVSNRSRDISLIRVNSRGFRVVCRALPRWSVHRIA